jgi:cystine transport system ATP-binding protein
MIVPHSTGAPLLTITNLRKRFGDRLVLDDLSLAVPRGQVVVILGPSGSGKTTLLRSINGLERPEAGSVAVADASVDFARPRVEADLREIRLRTAMVFQSFNLFPHRTALGNVIEGLCQVRCLPRGDAIERGMKLLARMGLADRCDDYPARLSGGQKQRVAIARGLAMEPELMLFDEPTSALDPGLRSEVLGVVRELAASGMTMLLVTHEMRFAQDVADRILFFDQGRIRVDAPPSEFFATTAPEVCAFLGQLA